MCDGTEISKCDEWHRLALLGVVERRESIIADRGIGGESTSSCWPGTEFPCPEHRIGIGNRLTLLDDEIPRNLNDIHLRNGVPPSGDLDSGDFTVEKETGTGKPYDLNCSVSVASLG